MDQNFNNYSGHILMELEAFGDINNSIGISGGRVNVLRTIPDSLHKFLEKSYVDKCFKHSYYQLLQKSMEGQFNHYFLVLEKNDGNLYIQPIFVAKESILKGLPDLLRLKIEKWIPKWLLSRCEIRMLMVGCSTGEGTLAGNICDHNEVAMILHEALPEVAKRLKTSLIVMKDFPSSYRESLKCFSSNDYIRIPSFPACKVDITGYRDFEDYMTRALSYKTRKNLRRKFREADHFGKFSMEIINDFTPFLDEVYSLYNQVLARSQFRFEILTKEYFSGLGTALEGRGRFFIWRNSLGKIVAFNLCVLDGKILRDCYIGLDYEIALDAHLYFVSIRDVISWAMENKIEQYYTSPLNYSAKLHLKFELAPLDLFVRHVSPMLNFFFLLLFPHLGPTQYDPLLAKFPNFKDL